MELKVGDKVKWKENIKIDLCPALERAVRECMKNNPILTIKEIDEERKLLGFEEGYIYYPIKWFEKIKVDWNKYIGKNRLIN